MMRIASKSFAPIRCLISLPLPTASLPSASPPSPRVPSPPIPHLPNLGARDHLLRISCDLVRSRAWRALRTPQSLDFEDCIDFGDDDKPPSAMAALVASINAKGASGAPAADSGAADVDGDRDPDGGDDDDDDDDDDEDDEDGGERRLSIRTGLLDEKASAAHCIAECAKHAGAAFAPHVERCLTSLLETHDYFHQDVRLGPPTAPECALRWRTQGRKTKESRFDHDASAHDSELSRVSERGTRPT